MSVQECLDAEQSDRETMKQEWSTFSASDRKHCIAEATMGGEFELYRTCHMSRNGAGRQEAENGAGGFKADRLMAKATRCLSRRQPWAASGGLS